MTLTAEGFKRKRYEDFLVELQEQAKELFGADVNLSDRSPMGQWIKLLAFARAEENEQTEAVYNARFVDTAEGVSLDYAVKNKSMYRFGEDVARGKQKISVDPGTTISQGFLVGTLDGIEFFTTTAATDSDNNGIIEVDIVAVNPGYKGNVPANTITEIVSPSPGVLSVTNETPTNFGRDRETDAELRNRYYVTVGESSTIEGIRSALINNVPGVRAAIVIENDRHYHDSDDRPPNSFEAIVYGGEPQAIGQAILSKKAGGIRAYGTQTVYAKDAAGFEHEIGFSLAKGVNIYANIDIITNSTFTTDGADAIRSKIVEYIGGFDKENKYHAGLDMAESVILGKVMAIVFGEKGVVNATVTLSKNGTTYVGSDVIVGQTEVVQTDFDKLVISVE